MVVNCWCAKIVESNRAIIAPYRIAPASPDPSGWFTKTMQPSAAGGGVLCCYLEDY